MYITNTNHLNSDEMNVMTTTTTNTVAIEDYNNNSLQNENKIMSKKLISMCFGCGNQITDQFILRVAPDLEWHAKCLKCFECGQYLDENCTCFVRNGKTFCKLDYVRLFSKKCFKCKDGFKKNDFVMRANNRIYHVDCFRCYMCNKQLTPGDEFAPRDDGLLCKIDNDLFEKHSLNNASSLINLQPGASSLASSSSSSSAPSSSSASPSLNNTNTTCQNITNLQQMNSNLMSKCDDLNINTDYEDNQNCLSPNHLNQQQYHLLNSPHSRHGHLQQQQIQNNTTTNNSNSSTASTSSTSSSSSNSSLVHHTNIAHSTGTTSGHHRKDKTTRVRTVLNEKQLHTLRTCYGANPRPDALMKEQLVEMTGLSPRVIRVWFQNKRCKDKKKTILIKQMQEQQKNRQTIGHGIPMIAGSPLRNDINNLGPGSQVEMQHTSNAYLHHHQSNHALSWKQMTEGYNLSSQLMDSNGNPTNQNGNLMHSNYDQMMGFQSDEEDCFDQLSDQGGDDSVSSVGLDDTRIQQL